MTRGIKLNTITDDVIGSSSQHPRPRMMHNSVTRTKHYSVSSHISETHCCQTFRVSCFVRCRGSRTAPCRDRVPEADRPPDAVAVAAGALVHVHVHERTGRSGW